MDDIPLRETSASGTRTHKKLIMRQYFVYMIQKRFGDNIGDTYARSIGMGVILPGSFTQGPRYMFNNFVDALQICNWIGYRSLSGTNLRPEDRPDILARVLKMKLNCLMSYLKKGKIFGRIRACNYQDLVEKYMIHGLYGLANQNSPYMKDGICTKRFSKSFFNRIEDHADGYPMYRRRENERTVVKKKTFLDNGFVVPYNRVLLKKYRAHINVNLCNQNKSIKYFLNYVNKGHDRVTKAFYQSNNLGASPESHDEIKMYYDCRYISPCEAAWRLFSFDIHFRDPQVIRLIFHVSDSQAVVFTDNDSLVDVLNRPTAKQTMFLAWFHAISCTPEARILRKIGFSIVRITNVPPGRGEDYYLRLLLNFQRGCTCYDDLRRIEDHVYTIFKDVCFALGLLDDNNEYIAGVKEAKEWANLLVANNMSRTEYVWECCWKKFAEDIAYRLQQRRTNSGSPVSDDAPRNNVLIEIENILQSNIKSLSNFPPMPIPIGSMMDTTVNKLAIDDLDYDVDAMREKLKKYLSSITDEQKKVFDDIMDVEHGGTGNTFIWKTLSAAIRSKGEIVINDETPMMHMYYFEALDKAMKSILDSDMTFGGKVVVIGGGFRQILPVVLKESRQDIVHATINSSPLWRQCKVMELNKNMRLQSSSSSANANEIKKFAEWILRIGNGDVGEVNDGDATIEIPDDMLIRDSADPFLDLIEFVYLDLGREILALTNESVDFVNDHFLSTITREEKVYFSSDSMCKEELLSYRIYNGTRLQVINMGKNILNYMILSGKHVGNMVFIPPMTLVPSNFALPIKFQRCQFQLMTLSYVGLYLPIPVVSHGQLYVALSRVKSRSGIKILINSKSSDTTNVTNNVVYKEVFQRI
ncbi:hypothetical protein ACP275_13G036900 [Erythranthe tilingii]